MAKWPYTTQRWQRLRRQKLQERPLCEYCLNEGRLTVAVVIDHIIPIARAAIHIRHWIISCPAAHRAITERPASLSSKVRSSPRKGSRPATCTAIRSTPTTTGTRHDRT